MTSRRTKISLKSGRGLGHVTSTIFGSTVGYPSDSLTSCLQMTFELVHIRVLTHEIVSYIMSRSGPSWHVSIDPVECIVLLWCVAVAEKFWRDCSIHRLGLRTKYFGNQVAFSRKKCKIDRTIEWNYLGTLTETPIDVVPIWSPMTDWLSMLHTSPVA